MGGGDVSSSDLSNHFTVEGKLTFDWLLNSGRHLLGAHGVAHGLPAADGRAVARADARADDGHPDAGADSSAFGHAHGNSFRGALISDSVEE